MTIIQIDNRFITPLKCGSRYLRSFGWETKGITMFNNGWETFKELNWEIIILRDPEERLKSALHTEILSLWNNHTNWVGITEEELINLFISKTGSTHWCGTLNKTIFDVYTSKNKQPKPLKLENLSLFLLKINSLLSPVKVCSDSVNTKTSTTSFKEFNLISSRSNSWEKVKQSKIFILNIIHLF